jgi:4'-phosphopantetheinyl transferase EntD
MSELHAAIRSPQTLFPHRLFSVETVAAPMDEALLHPRERALVRNAVAKRKGEFAAGRHCARQALARLDIRAPSILKDANGCPLWPEGAVGSISHTKGCVVSVVGRSGRVAALGVDVDSRLAPFPDVVLGHVCRPEELRWLQSMPAAAMSLHAYALFSVKETIYKCVYGATGERLGFADALLDVDLRTGLFRAQLTRGVGPDARTLLAGRVGCNAAHVFSGMWWLHAADTNDEALAPRISTLNRGRL